MSDTTTLLETQLKEIPDCSGCPLQYGCDLPEADFVWNGTLDEWPLNETNLAKDSAFESSRYLSASAASMALQAIQTLVANKLQPSDWTGLLSTEMSACVHSSGQASLLVAIEKLKIKLCEGYSAALFYARILFYNWFTYISDVCVLVPDSGVVDRAAFEGAQFYNKYSEMVTGIFWHAFDALTSTWQPSMCLRKCDLLHPRFFLAANWRNLAFSNRNDPSEGGEVARLPHMRGKCCGLQNNGNLCEVGEGPCKLNSDCSTGLICGLKNCLWSNGENCCTMPEAGTGYESEGHERIEDFSRAIGFEQLANLWWVNS